MDDSRHACGPFSGWSGTGRTIASPGLSLHRIVDGRIVEDWEYSDDIGQMRQLGFTLQPPEKSPA